MVRGRWSDWQGMRRLVRALTAIAFLALSGLAHAEAYEAAPGDYRETVKKLRAGDTLRFAPGEYRDGLPIMGLAGRPGRPIVISGPSEGPPATFVAQAGQNTVSIVDSSHVVIRHLHLEGNNLPVDAVKAEGHAHWAHHITLEDLVIRGHGNNQQTVAISTKCPAWNWVIRGVTIVGAGTGMYLGNSDGSAPFVAGLIERSLVVDSIGYNLEIKHQATRPDLPDMPRKPSITIIRHNVFAKPNAGLANSARPNVLVGHFPRTGPGVEDTYAIYGNFFYQNRHEALFQGEGNVALYANVFVNEPLPGHHRRVQRKPRWQQRLDATTRPKTRHSCGHAAPLRPSPRAPSCIMSARSARADERALDHDTRSSPFLLVALGLAACSKSPDPAPSASPPASNAAVARRARMRRRTRSRASRGARTTSTRHSPRPRSRASRCSCIGAPRGARPATRSRRRSSIARISSSARGTSFRSTSMATARARRSRARAST